MVTVVGSIVVINEQVVAETATTADVVVVNALHIMTSTGVNLVFGSSSAGITCGVPSSQCGDFVTGGGWITGTPSLAKGNFAVAGGIKNGGLWGHLTYQDHGANGPKVKGTGVTGYAVTGETSRRITGTADIDGQPGTYQVDVTDAGEPGRNDLFTLKLSTGYAASGTLQGGNIQIHNCQ